MNSSKKNIAFIDLAAQQKNIRSKIDSAIQNVLNHGRYILGPEVTELEEKLAEFVGVKHCIGVASGTDALLMGLMAKGIGPGDAVFTTPFTFIATAEVVSLLGATPVFVDIDPRTYNIDPTQLKLAIEAVQKNDPSIYPLPKDGAGTPLQLNAKAIIPVDLFGLPADYDTIMAIASEHDLFVLEDAAQGLGGVYKGKQAGGLAHMGTTSFFPAKPLGCYGDGGAIFTDDGEMADITRSLRVHGKGTDKYDNIRIGVNGRLHTMQAAILLPKLEIFPTEIEERQRVAKQYSDGFKNTELVVPFVPEGLRSVWAQYSLVCKDRKVIQSALRDKGIPTAVYYGKSLHLQPAYQELHYQNGDMPNSERISQNIFSLPMHPYQDSDEIEQIIKAVLAVL
ncbi:MAG: DegT/DnrJ/EryC1/StrS family aminotransferase [Desulfocapsa sp.]|uniref:DegT/DnrJ/EryC1/StrS family aminotransferase n=1 Tax=Desulfotalea psychrophila TaxID=84980 RepID=A0ABS3AUM9_9BACT|nr:DegT/DnrJ/EryC1/StrS family aminotransferase [Desulfocapsa sp.]MBN4068483.1 DegT/DnrJ/EryC1/StrS family aminotransferase [Desulfotalea psychrophila]